MSAPRNLRECDATCPIRSCKGKGTYKMSGHCTNCDWRGVVVFTRGHDAIGARCPRCELKYIRTKGWA